MNTKNNRRRRQSVERLETMFMDLLQEMELREIAVADLCKRCGLNRSTFYANYLDIYDMAEKVRKRLEEEVVFLFDPENISGSDYLNLFRHMREGWAVPATMPNGTTEAWPKGILTSGMSTTTWSFSGAVLTPSSKCGWTTAAGRLRRRWRRSSAASTRGGPDPADVRLSLLHQRQDAANIY